MMTPEADSASHWEAILRNAMDRETTPAPGASKPSATSRQRYQKPRILSLESLEAMAVACVPPLGKDTNICGNLQS